MQSLLAWILNECPWWGEIVLSQTHWSLLNFPDGWLVPRSTEATYLLALCNLFILCSQVVADHRTIMDHNHKSKYSAAVVSWGWKERGDHFRRQYNLPWTWSQMPGLLSAVRGMNLPKARCIMRCIVELAFQIFPETSETSETVKCCFWLIWYDLIMCLSISFGPVVSSRLQPMRRLQARGQLQQQAIISLVNSRCIRYSQRTQSQEVQPDLAEGFGLERLDLASACFSRYYGAARPELK